jgi:hypothetical protein
VRQLNGTGPPTPSLSGRTKDALCLVELRGFEPLTPLHAIDVRVVHVAMHHLTDPRNRAGERRCRELDRVATRGYV